jgi:hypothetical protein
MQRLIFNERDHKPPRHAGRTNAAGLGERPATVAIGDAVVGRLSYMLRLAVMAYLSGHKPHERAPLGLGFFLSQSLLLLPWDGRKVLGLQPARIFQFVAALWAGAIKRVLAFEFASSCGAILTARHWVNLNPVAHWREAAAIERAAVVLAIVSAINAKSHGHIPGKVR